ncbi:helix-turn-helix transcriptional regulator [Streptomyces sp. NPDC059460]|uniref:helix-turn-helix transcriptional regulator n=2 Tax=Streptomyces TaxID=1883 RepID=UPI0036AE6B48
MNATLRQRDRRESSYGCSVRCNTIPRVRSMMHDAVDALLERTPDLPAPSVRGQLRRAHRLTQQEVADALGVHRVQVVRWERGQAEPRNPHRGDYARLLAGLAARHPEAATTPNAR